MAINQPPITDNTVLDAWMLEVTREINRGRGTEVGTMTTTSDSSTPAQSVLLSQNDYTIRVTSNTETTYQFTMAGSSIPETHMLFLGGMRLCESTNVMPRDYSISGNTITLTRASEDFVGLDLVLTIFTASLT